MSEPAPVQNATANPATEQEEEGPSTLRSFLTIAGIALAIVVVLLLIAVFALGQTSLLPFNYQGFDGK